MRRVSSWIRAVFETERRQSAFFTLVLFTMGWWLGATYFNSPFPITEPLFQNLIAIVIGTFWVERLFTPPRDALANAFAGFALTLSLFRDPVYIRPLLVGLSVYYGIVLFSALFANWRPQRSVSTLIGWVYGLTNAIAVSCGRASVVYSLAFLATLTPLAKSREEHSLAGFLVFWVATVSLPHLLARLSALFKQETRKPVGLIRSAASPMNVEALIPKAEILSVGDLVGIEDKCRLCAESHPITCYGRVVNMLSGSQLPEGAQEAHIQIYGTWHTETDCRRKRNPFGLYEVADILGVGQPVVKFADLQEIPAEVRTLPIFAKHEAAVGYVLDQSSAGKLRFAVYPHKMVQRGDVVGVTLAHIDPEPLSVYYQVLDITTSEEEPTRPPFAMQYAVAAQVGVVEANGCFRTCDLTPYVRVPVWPAGEIPQGEPTELFADLGVLPRTKVPVKVDVNALVVYHAAILGTTGSGKTTLLRTLLPRVADQKIKVIVIDSHNEFNVDGGMDRACVLTIRSPDIPEAFALFVDSKLKALLEQMGSKQDDLDKAQEEIHAYAKLPAFDDTADVWVKRDSLTTSGKDKVVKRVLDEFVQEWYPRAYLVTRNEEDEGTDSLIILSKWYNQEEPWNRPILIVKVHGLSIDERQWVAGSVTKWLFGRARDEGLSQFIPETGDPRARVCLVVEEAHIFAPERGLSTGIDENARRFSEGELRNLILHGRKYGVGAIVASQRSAFLDKGVLSQCNTLFAMKTVSINDKRVFEDFMDSDWVRLVTYLGTPPESPQAILVGKAAASSIPLIIEYECSFPDVTGRD